MAQPVFRFKQFSVRHDRCAMKIGTDAILLGAWADVPQTGNILDIGTGTGVIALMMAQRSPEATIDAVEIDADAAQQARENFETSPWKDRLSVHHCALHKFSTDKRYDIIISNPPFFEKPRNEANTSRSTARHMDSLSIAELLQASSKIVSEEGFVVLVIPAWEGDGALAVAEKLGLFPHRITIVKGTWGSEPKRWLMQLCKAPKPLVKDELVIELARHQYTAGYIALTRDFYLKM